MTFLEKWRKFSYSSFNLLCSVDVLIGIFLSQSVANLQFSLTFTFAWRR